MEHHLPSLSELNIFSLISELEVYEKYWRNPLLIHTLYSSPFRIDKNPSFNIFICNKTGRLKWKDFATGEFGNVIEFIRKIKSLSYRDVLILINLDFELNLDNSNIRFGNFVGTSFIQKNEAILDKIQREKNKKDINFEKLFWTNYSSQYFKDYKISLSGLNKYNVSPVSKINIDGKTVSYYSKDNPIYHYSFTNEEWKTLQPNNKKYKWLSNVNGETIEGFEQVLDHCGGDKPLILTKSLKDVMVLNELGYPAVSLTNENAKFDLDKKDRLSSFNEIILLYDNDKTGINSSNKIAAKYELKNIFIPKESGYKDISDYSKDHSLSESKDLIERLIDDN